MKKILIASFFLTLIFGGANAVEWWNKPTICMPSEALCYPQLKDKPEFDAAMDRMAWDSAANCKGKKKVCPNAIQDANITEAALMSKSDILNPGPDTVSPDFDFEAVDRRAQHCFGLRKTRNNRSEARVSDGKGSKWVRVYCKELNVYDDPDEEDVPDDKGTGVIGTIMPDGQEATCQTLEENHIISVLNGNCYGLKTNDVFIQCGDNKDDKMPEKLVNLNGATASTSPQASNDQYPTNERGVEEQFEKMRTNAKDQRHEHAVAIVTDSTE